MNEIAPPVTSNKICQAVPVFPVIINIKLQDKIPCSEMRKRTKIIDIIEYTLKQKWRWAGRIARMKDNRWTKCSTEWQPRRGKRSRGRPSRRWQDDITIKEGGNHLEQEGNRQKAMEDIDGGLHPAVDGQSLVEVEVEKITEDCPILTVDPEKATISF